LNNHVVADNPFGYPHGKEKKKIGFHVVYNQNCPFYTNINVSGIWKKGI
jgi:acetyltransferase-like isoleucine patch superfamily enzyme